MGVFPPRAGRTRRVLRNRCISYDEALRGTYRPAVVGEQFGPHWFTHWHRVDLAIRTDWRGEEVHLLWDSSSEACVWVDGVPAQGLTGADDTRRENRGRA